MRVALAVPSRTGEVGHAACERACLELRAELDERTESVGRKIRDAELRKVPYMLVVGDREAESGAVSVREHRVGDSGSMPVAELVAMLAEKSARREG